MISQPHLGQHQQVESLSILEAILRGLEAQIEKGKDDIIGILCEFFSNLTLKENPKQAILELITFNSKEPKSTPNFGESKPIIDFGKLKICYPFGRLRIYNHGIFYHILQISLKQVESFWMKMNP